MTSFPEVAQKFTMSFLVCQKHPAGQISVPGNSSLYSKEMVAFKGIIMTFMR